MSATIVCAIIALFIGHPSALPTFFLTPLFGSNGMSNNRFAFRKTKPFVVRSSGCGRKYHLYLL